MTYQLQYQGSVKNLYRNEQQEMLFEYSDRYSLFDWGEMPDHIEQKGEALALMGALFFKEVDKLNIPHHFLGLTNKDGVNLDWVPTRYLKVKEIPVYRPPFINGDYDYSFYQSKPQQGLVPLEVMFRFGVGKGSSLSKRIATDATLLKQWNLDKLEEGKLWDLPVIDFSTKLEKGDRYLTHAEARKLSGLSDKEFTLLQEQTIRVALLLRQLFNEMKLELWDGKLEWAFLPGSERSFMLVDSIGLDELRIQKGELSLSKEFLREYYRTTPWFSKLVSAKEAAAQTGEDFKHLCSEEPPRLPTNQIKQSIHLYLGFTNELAQKVIGRKVFDEQYTLAHWGDA